MKKAIQKTASVVYLLIMLLSAKKAPALELFGNPNLQLKPYVSASIGTNGFQAKAGANLEYKIETEIGNITPRIGAKATYSTNFLNQNISGLDYEIFGMMEYNLDNVTIGLSTHFWGGIEPLDKFAQQTGALELQIDNLGPENNYKLKIRSGNDGAPFHLLMLADFWDRYRTAELGAILTDTKTNEIAEASLRFFTGERRKDLENKEDMIPIIDQYGNKYPKSYVCEIGEPYRLSEVTLSYKNGDNLTYYLKIHDDGIRHLLQDRLAHGLLDPQGGFKTYSNGTTFDAGISYDLFDPETNETYTFF